MQGVGRIVSFHTPTVFLALISAILGLLAMLADAIGLLVVGIVKLVYLYRTAKRFREYQPAALQKEVL